MRQCLECPVMFKIPTAPSRKDRKKFCSKICANKGCAKLSAKKRGDVQRGRGEGKTYTKLYGQHMHRVIMENHLNRKLKSDEIVHHIDGNIKNNDINNLMLMDRVTHAIHHHTKYAPLCIVDGCNGKHYLKGNCIKHYYQIKRNGKIYVQTNYTCRVASSRKKHEG